MKKKSRFLQTPIEPFTVEGGLTADQVLARMERISFQGRNLATALHIWQKMLQDDVTIFLGMAGALSAGGLRLIVAHLVTHRYALQIVTDVPHFGGASGSSLEEAQSWGKLSTDSARVSVQADATIALPLLVSALATTAAPLLHQRTMPVFTVASRVMTLDGHPIPSERFEEVNESAV